MRRREFYLNPRHRHLKKRQEEAVVLLKKVHCYATHYLSQNR